MKNKIKVGIIGGAGYTGGELIRLLLHHPDAEINYIVSKSQQSKPVWHTHTDLIGDTDLVFSAAPVQGADVVFLCLQHGEVKEFLKQHEFLFKKKIIDLSRDYRLCEKLEVKNKKQLEFVYGLPELSKEKIKKAKYVANPGCFATAIQLSLLPLAEKAMLKGDVHINATTGSTGAGQSLSQTSHFSWRNGNLSVYKTFKHEHIPEINQSILQLQPGFSSQIYFVPQRGSFTRGILSAATLTCNLSEEEVNKLYHDYYASHSFVHTVNAAEIKQVVNTNKCFIQIEKNQNQLAIISVLDNLIKGASGQAVQNMNLMFGLDETKGLKLKASVY